jgi:hypothetical protein
MLTGPASGLVALFESPSWMSAVERNFLKRSRTLAPGSEADQATSRKWSDLRLITYVRPDSNTLATRSGLRDMGESMQEIPRRSRSGDPLFAVTVASPGQGRVSRPCRDGATSEVARIADAAPCDTIRRARAPVVGLPHSLTPCAGRA